MIDDPERAAKQALSIVLNKEVISFEGSPVSIEAQTICIHGDTPNAVTIARAVRKRLMEERVKIASLESFI